MRFSDQAASQQWAGLTYRGQRFAEVWFKPKGDPCALTFRVPQHSFQLPGIRDLLTTDNLLKAVGVAADQVDSWHRGDHAGSDAAHEELTHPLAPPPEDAAHLIVHVRLKPPQVGAAHDSGASKIPLAQVQDLEARWNAIVSAESAIDQLRLRVEAAQGEMEAASQRVLATDEKHYASNADILQWTKAKGRARYALPKAKEFIHRATWAIGTPERKNLAGLFKDGLRPDLPLSTIDKLPDELARLLKSHQVLAGQGAMVHQECKAVTAEIQGTLRTLLNNSSTNAKNKRVASHKKGKYV